MATVTTLNADDTGAVSRSVINTNFTNLNTDKIETSVLDTDGTLAANSDTKVATQKAVKTYVDANSTDIETSSGTTHSLTTGAGQKVVVWATGEYTGTGSAETITLSYNGVSKRVLDIQHSNTWKTNFTLMYTETPGATTANITVSSTGTIADVNIFVIKAV